MHVKSFFKVKKKKRRSFVPETGGGGYKNMYSVFFGEVPFQHFTTQSCFFMALRLFKLNLLYYRLGLGGHMHIFSS